MTDAAKLRTRAATPADASAIAAIYNEGIADRIATFETEPRSATDIAGWFTGEHLVVVAETGETGLVAFAASFPYSSRACYRGIGEFSVYVTRNHRRTNSSGGGTRDAQAHQPGVSGERGQPCPFERPRFRGNRDSSATRAIG